MKFPGSPFRGVIKKSHKNISFFSVEALSLPGACVIANSLKLLLPFINNKTNYSIKIQLT